VGFTRSVVLKFLSLMSKIIRSRTRHFTQGTAIAIVLLAVPLLKGQSSLTLPENTLPLLQQQLEAAMQSSPTMIIRQANTAATLADFQGSKSSRYPSLGGWANYLRAEDDRNNAIGGARPATKLGYNFTIRKSLYHWGNLERGIENAKIQTLIDQGNTRAAYMTLAADIRREFLELISGKQRLEKHRYAFQINKERLRETQEKREQNLVSAADLFRTNLAFQRSELSVAESRDQLDHALRVFGRLTGEPPLTEAQIPTEFAAPPFEQQEEILVAMATRFLATEMPENSAIQIAKHYITLSENELKNNRNSLRPQFDLLAGISQDEQDFALDTDSYEFQSIFGGVSMSWNLFDGFATRNRVKSSLARLRASELQLELQQEALIDNVRSLGREIKHKGMALHIQEQELQSSRSHLEYTQELAGRGEASAADVDSAFIGLQDSLSIALYIRYEYWNKLSEFLGLIEADPVLNRAPPLN